MTDMHRRSGSIILLVVGLLTILAMLGSTLLISSHLDAKQSRALAQQAPTDPIAAGIVKQIQQILKRDLHFDTSANNGPYENARDTNTVTPWPATVAPAPWDGSRAWKAFIDMPAAEYPPGAPENDAADPWLTDIWLASDDLTETATSSGVWTYSYLSDITGELLPEQCRMPRFTPTDPANLDEPWTLETDPTRSGTYTPDLTRRPVDTDGDSIADAILVDSGVTNAEGQKYYFAARVTDLSGKICVNTAGQSGIFTSPTSPVNVDLEKYLDGASSSGTGTNISDLHEARAAGNSISTLANMQAYYDDAACLLLTPNTTTVSYRPFAIGEEMFFRWLGGNTLAGSTGRFAALADPSNTLDRASLQTRLPYLTTFNSSRAIPRLPSNVAPIATSRLDLTDPTILDLQDNKDFLYDQLVAAGATPSEAGHFVANLWASISQDDFNETAFEFIPTAGPSVPVYYGIVPQLVISEVYAYNCPESAGGAGDYGWVFAIELLNPSDSIIEINNLGGAAGAIQRYYVRYKDLSIPGAPYITFSLPTMTLNPDNRVVLYDFNGSYETTPKPIGSNLPSFGIDAATDIRVPGLNLAGDVSIMRAVQGSGILLDTTWGTDFGYNPPLPFDVGIVTGPINGQIGARDDDPGRNRVLVGGDKSMYRPPPFDNSNLNSHTLGDPNLLAAGDVPTADVLEGFEFSPINAPLNDMTDLADIYITGPTGGFGEDNFPVRLAAYRQNDTRGKLDFRGTVSGTPVDYPDVPWPMVLPELIEPLVNDNDRIYGRININSASREVLMQLPWPTGIDTTGDTVLDTTITAADIEMALDYIITYRDRTRIDPGDPSYAAGLSPDYRSTTAAPPGPGRADATTIAGLRVTSDIANLRATSDYDGYLTPGEIAAPLSDFGEIYILGNLLGGAIPSSDRNYQSIRDSFYAPISNLVTVNSDTYAVNIRVDLYDADESPEDPANYAPQHTWYYIAVIDRSNCYDNTQTPAVLLFSEVK